MTDASAGAGKGGRGRVLVLAIGVLLFAVGIVLLLAGPTLFNMGLIDRDFARFELTGIAMYVMAAAVVVGLVGLIYSLAGKKQRGAIVGVVLMTAAGVAGGTLYAQATLKDDLPPINDVQTDWSQPVAFTEKTLREREHAGAIRVRDDAVVPEGNGKWSGMTYAEAQKNFYAEVEPLKVKQGAPEATLAAAKAAKTLGWDVMMESPPEGMMEAVYHEPWYQLVYDIAVRVTPDGQGSRIDVRATSRTDDRDMGETATRVTELINEIALQLR
jgi:fatty-acyl-CoA synthase